MSEKGISTTETILGILIVGLWVLVAVLFFWTSAKIDQINLNGQELTEWANSNLHHWAVDTHATLHLHVPGTMHQPPPPPPPW